MPTCFHESFRKCAVIIDCFEIFIEKPAEHVARASTYDMKKTHHRQSFDRNHITRERVFYFRVLGKRSLRCLPNRKQWIAIQSIQTTEPGGVLIADRRFTLQERVSSFQSSQRTKNKRLRGVLRKGVFDNYQKSTLNGQLDLV